MVQTKDPLTEAILDPATFIWKNLVKGRQPMLLDNFKDLDQAVLQKKIVKFIFYF